MKYWLIPLGIFTVVFAGYDLVFEPYLQKDPATHTDQKAFDQNNRNTTKIETSAQVNLDPLNHLDKNGQLIAKLAHQVKSQFSQTIESPLSQIKLLALKKQLILRHPKQGDELFTQVISSAFPEHAEEIILNVEKYDQYNVWLEQTQSELNHLAALEKDGILWQKRRELFGALAPAIWESDRDQLSQKRSQLQSSIHRLNNDFTLSVEEKLFQLKESLSDVYGALDQTSLTSPEMLSHLLLKMDSVQAHLRTLQEDERKAALKRIRTGAGFSDEQTEEYALLDKVRLEEWLLGKNYLDEREALIKDAERNQWTEATLQTKLYSLQDTSFGIEKAGIIRSEESMGYFRYSGPISYGKL